MKARREPYNPKRDSHDFPRPGAPKFLPPLLSVVVFAEPGPDEMTIHEVIHSIFRTYSPVEVQKGKGHMIVERDEFDAMWVGVERGDAFGITAAVLPSFGPEAELVLMHIHEISIGVQGHKDDTHGQFLMLQLFPQNPRLASKLDKLRLITDRWMFEG